MNANKTEKIEKKKYKCKWECQNCKTPCFPTTAESRCICGHRLRNHNGNGIKHSCSEKNCGCKGFFYIPSEGSWMLRCRCKRKATEHDYKKPYKSTKPPLAGVVCNGFDSPWICNCGCGWQDHKQRFEEVAPFNPLLHFNPEDFEGLMTSDIKRGDFMEHIPGAIVNNPVGSSISNNNNVNSSNDNYYDNNYDNNKNNSYNNNNYNRDYDNYNNNNNNFHDRCYYGNQNTVFTANNNTITTDSMIQQQQQAPTQHQQQQPSKSVIKSSLALLKKKSENMKNYG